MKGCGICATKQKCMSSTSTPIVPHGYKLVHRNRKYKSDDTQSVDISESKARSATQPSQSPQPSFANMKKINSNIYDTGRILKQNTREFPIILKVRTTYEDDEVTIHLDIPIPTGYTETKLTKVITRDKYPSFCLFSITFASKKASLNYFFVKPQKYLDISTSQEKTAFKGIGRVLLGFSLWYYFTNIRPFTRDMFDYKIELSAEGGSLCNVDPIFLDNNLSFKFLKGYIDKNFTKPNGTYMDNIWNYAEYFQEKHIDLLREFYCKVEHEKRLVKYYKSLGFTIQGNKNIYSAFRLYINVETIYIGVYMEAPILTIARKCHVNM
jgi:hypothetical protein